jgi:hypothetical protein
MKETSTGIAWSTRAERNGTIVIVRKLREHGVSEDGDVVALRDSMEQVA